MSLQNNIPSLDLNDFKSNDQNLKKKFVTQLGKAYEDIKDYKNSFIFIA